MNDSLIVEILLGVMSVAVAFGSYLGATRAKKAEASAAEADIDAEAFNRAKGIYESAISALENQLGRVRTQLEMLDSQVQALQTTNRELRTQLIELQDSNIELQKTNRVLHAQVLDFETQLRGKLDV